MSDLTVALTVTAYLLAVACGALLYVTTIDWSCRDARLRGKSGLLVALVVALLPWWPVGLVVWLIFRPAIVDSEGVPLRFKPRFTISMLLIVMAVVAFAATLGVATGRYEAVSYLRVRPPAPGAGATASAQYRIKENVASQLYSDATLRSAIERTTAQGNAESVDELRQRLRVRTHATSEIISISLDGHVLRDNPSEVTAMLDAIVASYVKQSSGNATSVVVLDLASVVEDWTRNWVWGNRIVRTRDAARTPQRARPAGLRNSRSRASRVVTVS